VRTTGGDLICKKSRSASPSTHIWPAARSPPPATEVVHFGPHCRLRPHGFAATGFVVNIATGDHAVLLATVPLRNTLMRPTVIVVQQHGVGALMAELPAKARDQTTRGVQLGTQLLGRPWSPGLRPRPKPPSSANPPTRGGLPAATKAVSAALPMHGAAETGDGSSTHTGPWKRCSQRRNGS